MVSVAESGGPLSDVTTESKAKPAPRRKVLFVLPLLTALAAAGGVWALVGGANKETTDDAQVEAHVAFVAPHVAGQVKRVLVKDNQHVKAGDVLVELDARDLNVRLASARADVAAAKASLRSSETQLGVTKKSVASNLAVARGGMAQAASASGTANAGIEQARAEITAALSRQKLAQLDFDRTSQLFASNVVAKSSFDATSAALEQATANVSQAQARLRSAEANRQNSSGSIESARGRVIAAEAGPEQIEAAEAAVQLASAKLSQAEAALQQAELNVSYTQIKAEISGVVSRRSVEVGQMASPEKPLLALVPLDDTWVVANFKEDQIAHMRPGQLAEIEVDAFDGQKLKGHIDSLAGGTGSRFSLLPPDNASGNFTKVVQRVPVLLRIDSVSDLELRPGLSAKVTVVTK
ncbi:MAG TPA: HlyD family secretion protein [Polyangiaceae bacterium]|nr:HlyD family secretion protein [Polyangiaceae bacterium]